MRTLAPIVAIAVVAACGGAASGLATPTPEPSPTLSASATATAVASATAATASATSAIAATIVPIGTAPPGTTPVPTVAPSPTPSPAPGGLTQAQLKYRLVDQFGRIFFCDPDFFPIARGDEQAQADARFPEIQKDPPTFSAILAHLGIAPAGTYSAEQRLAVYREWKMLNALRLEQVSGGFHFNAVFSGNPSGSGNQGTRIDGVIDDQGAISVASRTPSGRPPCPICLARGTGIATPDGERRVEDLRVGDVVWTIDAAGSRIAAALVAVGSTPVPATHLVVRLVLSDSRAVDVSPGHPSIDGRAVSELVAGDSYDGAVIVSAERVHYSGGATFDILPAGPTGAYWANGVPLDSTLR